MTDYQGVPWEDFFKEPEEPAWYYKPLLTRTSRVMLITGDPGVGKTFFTLNLAMAMAARTPFLGMEFQGPPVTVAYLDLEMGPFITNPRCRNIARDTLLREAHNPLRNFHVYYDSMPPLEPGFEMASNKFKKCLVNLEEHVKPDIVFAEPLAYLFGESSLNENSDGYRLFAKLRSCPWNWVINHHETKNKYEADGKTLKAIQYRGLGGIAIMGSVERNLSIMNDPQDKTESMKRVAWGKVRDWMKPADFRYRQEDGRVIGSMT